MTGEPESRAFHDTRPALSQLRASDEDRDTVIEVLRVAAGDGRLTADELDERLEVAFSARTYGELASLVADLPLGAMPAPLTAAAAAQVTPKDLITIDCRSGHTAKDGRWVVPRRMEIKVASGHVRLDFTDAVIAYPVLDISVTVRAGHLRIVTRPGIVVDSDDVKLSSGHVRIKAPWGADVPVRLRVNLSGKVGSGHILAAPPRRTFWQWITRQAKPLSLPAASPVHGPDQRPGLSRAGQLPF